MDGTESTLCMYVQRCSWQIVSWLSNYYAMKYPNSQNRLISILIFNYFTDAATAILHNSYKNIEHLDLHVNKSSLRLNSSFSPAITWAWTSETEFHQISRGRLSHETYMQSYSAKCPVRHCSPCPISSSSTEVKPQETSDMRKRWNPNSVYLLSVRNLLHALQKYSKYLQQGADVKTDAAMKKQKRT
jgi:hypothetical protein